MDNKRAVQFRKQPKSAYQWHRLRYCKSCGSYTILLDDPCKSCKAQAFITLKEYAAVLNKRLFHAEAMGFAAFLGVAAVAARTLPQLGIALGGAFILIALYILLRRRFRTLDENFRVQKIAERHAQRILQGLISDADAAGEDMKAERFKEAYEKLREISTLLSSEQIKNLKVMCLNRFIIRKDMDLELETVLPSVYNQEFVAYLFEVSKVNKSLIRKSVLEYILEHRIRIERLPYGKELMVNAAAASLRMKPYISLFHPVLFDYLELLPKERFLRLCKLVSGSPPGPLGKLEQACKGIAKVHYGFDPDVQGLWQEG